MSSSPPTEASPTSAPFPSRLFAGWSLRARLLAAIIALLAVVCLIIGVATTLALRAFLIDQLDAQLAAAAGRAASTPPGAQALFPPGQSAGTITVRVVHGQVAEAAVLDPAAANGLGGLTAEQQAVLVELPADGHPHTRDLGDLGDYRLIASVTAAGDVLVTGLPMTDVQDTVWRLVAIEAAVVGAGLLAAVAAGAMIVRVSLRPLRRVAATATRVGQLPLDRGEVALSERVPAADTDSRTEVGQVGAALNRMLGHIAAALAARQGSEMRVRHFVADASHELRTPLAAIRGYAEVARRRPGGVPADIAQALRRVESESARMTALVDDLLLLARLDSGRPLATDTVDLSVLVVDAVNDAHVAGPRHHWLLQIPQEAISVPGDAARLHQVLGNLLANARVHTPPGTTVTTTLTTEDSRAIVSVVDDGPGIPAELQPEAFERFARGDTSRSRVAGSTGLGLAIVAAVVDAHHGTVDLTSRPGHTAFTVRLPRHPVGAAG